MEPSQSGEDLWHSMHSSRSSAHAGGRTCGRASASTPHQGSASELTIALALTVFQAALSAVRLLAVDFAKRGLALSMY